MRVGLSKIAIFFFIVGIISCSQDADQKNYNTNEIAHPTPINYISKDSVTTFINDSFTDFVVDSSSLNKINSIGIREGNSNYMFGRITSVSIINDTEIVVLDDQSGGLRAFDLISGEFITSFSKTGRGPGEIMYASQMTSDKNHVFVSDRLQKIEIFERTDEQKFKSTTLNLNYSPGGICVIGDNLYVSGFDQQNLKTVHKYNIPALSYQNSFHNAYKADSGFSMLMLSNNRITCNKTTETVAVVSSYLPYVYGYDIDGEVKWVSEINNFTPVSIVETNYDRPGIDKEIRPDGKTDIYSNLSSTNDSSLIYLQLNRLIKKAEKL